jgi:hypothetical protein
VPGTQGGRGNSGHLRLCFPPLPICGQRYCTESSSFVLSSWRSPFCFWAQDNIAFQALLTAKFETRSHFKASSLFTLPCRCVSALSQLTASNSERTSSSSFLSFPSPPFSLVSSFLHASIVAGRSRFWSRSEAGGLTLRKLVWLCFLGFRGEITTLHILIESSGKQAKQS